MNGLLQEKAMICFKSIICLLFTVVAMSIYGMEVGPDASAVKSEGCWIEVSCDSLSLTNEGIFVCINGQLFKVNSLQAIIEGKYTAIRSGQAL